MVADRRTVVCLASADVAMSAATTRIWESKHEEFPGCRVQRAPEGSRPADAGADRDPGADQGEGGRHLPQRSAYMGRRLRSRPRAQAAVAEGSRRLAATHDGA